MLKSGAGGAFLMIRTKKEERRGGATEDRATRSEKMPAPPSPCLHLNTYHCGPRCLLPSLLPPSLLRARKERGGAVEPA